MERDGQQACSARQGVQYFKSRKASFTLSSSSMHDDAVSFSTLNMLIMVFNSAPKRLPIPPNELSMACLALEVSGQIAGVAHNPWNDSPPSASSAHDCDSSDEIAGLSYFPSQFAVSGSLPCPAIPGQDQPLYSSRSPTSEGSSILHTHQPQLPMAERAVLSGQEHFTCNALPYGFPGAMTACTRDAVEQQSFGTTLDAESLACQSYFAWIHDQIPIIHKPSFFDNPEQNSPLLLAAVMALGGQALGRHSDNAGAQVLHEQCVKVLKRVCESRSLVLPC